MRSLSVDVSVCTESVPARAGFVACAVVCTHFEDSVQAHSERPDGRGRPRSEGLPTIRIRVWPICPKKILRL